MISFVSGKVDPFPATAQYDSGYNIQAPPDNILKTGQNYTFDFHISNISNGMPIVSNTGCNFHLYNSTGDHIYEARDNIASSDFDYSFYINGKNFTQSDAYYYYIHCNSTTLGGDFETILRVYNSGIEPTPGVAIIIVGVLASIVGLIFVFQMLSFRFSETKMWYLSIFFLAVSVVLTLYTLHLGYIFNQDFTNYANIMGVQVSIYLMVIYTTAVLLILAFVIFMIKILMNVVASIGGGQKISEDDILPGP